MSKISQERLFELFESVLEQYSFMFCEIIPKDEVQTDSTQFVRSTLEFQGPYQGHLSLIVPDALCLEIAGNVLGTEPDDEDAAENARDALNELVNVFLGHVLTDAFGPEMDFDFGVPECEYIDEPGWNNYLRNPDAIAITLEDTPAILSLEVNAT